LEQLQKQYKELTFTDDFMFGKVLVNNPEICRRLLEDLTAFLQYLKGVTVENELVQMIDNEVEKVKEHKEWEVEYMTLYMRDLDNQDIGLEKGLEALVTSLKEFIKDTETLYQAVIKNEVYKDTPREEVMKYLN